MASRRMRGDSRHAHELVSGPEVSRALGLWAGQKTLPEGAATDPDQDIILTRTNLLNLAFSGLLLSGGRGTDLLGNSLDFSR